MGSGENPQKLETYWNLPPKHFITEKKDCVQIIIISLSFELFGLPFDVTCYRHLKLFLQIIKKQFESKPKIHFLNFVLLAVLVFQYSISSLNPL